MYLNQNCARPPGPKNLKSRTQKTPMRQRIATIDAQVTIIVKEEELTTIKEATKPEIKQRLVGKEDKVVQHQHISLVAVHSEFADSE
jgi:hypothetical protein